MFRAGAIVRSLAQNRLGQFHPIFLLLLIGMALGPSIASAQQLTLSWIDNSGGQAGFIVQRAIGTTGSYSSIAQTPAGVTTFTDSAVSSGTTYCYQVAATTNAGTSSFSNVACASPSGGFTLAMADRGTGTGVVTSSPAGINCGTACTATFPTASWVTVSATPAAGSVFSGWSGGCSGTGSCTMSGNGTISVTANFAALQTYSLVVATKGPGTVTSSPNGISCGATCSASYVSGTTVTLTAVPGRGAQFIGWNGGGCSGTGTCTVTLASNVSVTASFSKGGKK